MEDERHADGERERERKRERERERERETHTHTHTEVSVADQVRQTQSARTSSCYCAGLAPKIVDPTRTQSEPNCGAR